MISIGSRKQITEFNLLVPAGEHAWIEIPIEDWTMRIKLTFSNEIEDNTHGFSITSFEDYAVLNLNNWNNNLPMGIEKPFEIATVNGQPIEVMFSGYSIGEMKKVEFIVLWGKSK